MGRGEVVRAKNEVDDVCIAYSGYRSQLDYEFFENFDSEHTKAAYKRDLIQFFHFVNKEFGQISSPQQLDTLGKSTK